MKSVLTPVDVRARRFGPAHLASIRAAAVATTGVPVGRPAGVRVGSVECRLGATGLHVSRICLGMMSYGSSAWRDWALDLDAARPLVRSAVDAGVIFFDTADMYADGASEEVTGSCWASSSPPATTTCWRPRSSTRWGPARTTAGCRASTCWPSIDASLRRLGTDHVDLYQIHRWDPHTPIEETMEALHDVVRAGKARYIGASRCTPGSSRRRSTRPTRTAGRDSSPCRTTTTSSTARRSGRCIPLCADQGVGVIPWSPLARGRLAKLPEQRTTTRSGSDVYAERMYTEADDAVVQAVADVAKARGLPFNTAPWAATAPSVSEVTE